MLGMLVVQGRPDRWSVGHSQTHTDRVVLAADSQQETAAAAHPAPTTDEVFCVQNELSEVTILLTVTSLVNGNEVDDKTTAKSGTPACLQAPPDGTDITFSTFVNDSKPPIFLFNVTFADIPTMDKACTDYKVTGRGYYPNCSSAL
ncbi:unnamed protein product [Ostreobium quekettii]|uniref:Uncharacterized protein n=1 Tax=Ostreobium quekettii TaxID=121088 RepID=A0A8S1J9Y0_9CHLO|nr:unnamed protein product [Ostreobium quekettii]